MMGSQLQTGNTSITGSVSATVTPVKSTMTLIEADRTTAGSTTMLTVAANKIVRVLYINLFQDNQGTALAYSEVDLNGVRALRGWFTGTAGATGGYSENVVFDYDACPVLTEGQTIVFTTSTAEDGGCTVGYVQENV